MRVPLKQYLSAKRIAHAKAQLQAGESVTDTAFSLGFCTVSHFIVVFKRITGMTPGDYKRRYAGAEGGGALCATGGRGVMTPREHLYGVPRSRLPKAVCRRNCNKGY